MIDLHCHILPDLDDGAIDMDDSVAMTRVAQADGITFVCATPHIHPSHEVRIVELSHRVEAVNDRLGAQGVSTQVVTGGEVAQAMVDRLTDLELTMVSLGGSDAWILLEPSPGPLDHTLLRCVEGLADRGFRSLVAHPERHAGPDFERTLERLVSAGALIQVTSALIADGPAAPTMLELASRGLVHIVASDAHSSHGGRPATISEGLDRLADVPLLQPHRQWIARDAAAAILAGDSDLQSPFA